MKSSKTFCVYPWIHQTVLPTGKIGLCCVAKSGAPIPKSNHETYSVNKDTLKDAWNSPYMRAVRKQMLDGKELEVCKLCHFQEGIGKKSYRQMHNEEWTKHAQTEIKKRVENSKNNDYRVEEPPLYLDLRLGNICNLKCRMCNPFNSTKILAETNRLLRNNKDFKNFWAKYNSNDKPVEPIEKWYESDDFWDEVIGSISKLKKVYLTGGEPTLIENNYRFMQACVESGKAKDIFLMFNINGTQVTERFLSYLPNFKFVLINVSIDGYGKLNEYIRKNSKWDIVDENLRKLLVTGKNVQVGITPVIVPYNILKITELLDYVDVLAKEYAKDINVDFLYVKSPSYLDVASFPLSLRKTAAQRLRSFKEVSASYQKNVFFKNSIDSCLRLLEEEGELDSQKVTDFKEYTSILDEERKELLVDFEPELVEYLKGVNERKRIQTHV